jgi:hypothetical protein
MLLDGLEDFPVSVLDVGMGNIANFSNGQLRGTTLCVRQ